MREKDDGKKREKDVSPPLPYITAAPRSWFGSLGECFRFLLSDF